jgi:hypothetical protein
LCCFEQARRGYEDRLSMEINKLQKETTVELSSIRNAQKQVHESEVTSLKDRLNATQDAHSTLMTDLNELRATHESLVLNVSKERSDHQSSMAELRSRLKIKAFEQGRLNLLVEEQRESLSKAQLNNKKHEQRFAVLRDEFVKLEAEGMRREIEHEAVLSTEREKVMGYEALEMELDGAFVSEAMAGGGGGVTNTLLPVSLVACCCVVLYTGLHWSMLMSMLMFVLVVLVVLVVLTILFFSFPTLVVGATKIFFWYAVLLTTSC